jgi:hypothetical protein
MIVRWILPLHKSGMSRKSRNLLNDTTTGSKNTDIYLPSKFRVPNDYPLEKEYFWSLFSH